MRAIPLIGRIFFSLIFLQTAVNNFSRETISYATSQNVPLATVLVTFSGVLAILGGVSIVLGYKARWGAWLIVLFLVPVTLMMHNFWTVKDPMMHQMQTVMFMKNISMLGGALLITWFGSGPLSMDAQKQNVIETKIRKTPTE